jgi:hypothetical protein
MCSAHGAAGAVKRLSFRTLLRGNEEQDDRQALGRSEHGAMMRVYRCLSLTDARDPLFDN